VSNGWATGTAIKELVEKEIPINKLVIGKPATVADAYNTGWVNFTDLGDWGQLGY